MHSENPTLAMHILTTLGVIVLIFHLSRARLDLGREESASQEESSVIVTIANRPGSVVKNL